MATLELREGRYTFRTLGKLLKDKFGGEWMVNIALYPEVRDRVIDLRPIGNSDLILEAQRLNDNMTFHYFDILVETKE